jgi:ABC-type antimicrobial peptide transport system permease subunit
MLKFIFDIVIVINMFLCLFSLSGNMSANIQSQTKEIAVMRAMGLTKVRVKLIYFYEALVLVMAACMLGVFIGVVVGYTMAI